MKEGVPKAARQLGAHGSTSDALEALDRATAELAGTARLLHAVTPANAKDERVRLAAAFSQGGEAMPRWTYAATAKSPSPAAIAELARVAQRTRGALGHVYLARIEELTVELAIQNAAGTPALADFARRRFATDHADADATALRWVAAHTTTDDDAPKRASDDPDPRSLRGLLEAEIGHRRLPFGVRVVDGLASLAATGAQNVYVARGRSITDDVAQRTAIHEIDGHVAPRARARAAPLRIFFVGTAGGHDTQEGYALWHEEKSGLLDGARRAELGMRHLACAVMDRGADFVEVVRHLTRERGAEVTRALSIAERIFRGSDGKTPGLGRERVYLPRFLEVRARLMARPDDARILGSGQLGLDVLDLAREILDRAVA